MLAVLPRARSKQIGGMVKILRENKVLAMPLENTDKSAFITRLSISVGKGGGGGGVGGGRRSSIIPTVRSIVTKLGKMQVGKTATLETYNFGKVQFWK